MAVGGKHRCRWQQRDLGPVPGSEKRERIALLAILLLFPVAITAQTIPFRQYTVQDGLPSNEVYSIHSDSSGFLWFGTDRGLARFDGREFTTYTRQDGLGGSVIFDLTADPKGGFYAVALNLTVTRVRNGEFQVLKRNQKELAELPNHYFRSVFQHNQSVYALISPNLYRFDEDTVSRQFGRAPTEQRTDSIKLGGGFFILSVGQRLLRIQQESLGSTSRFFIDCVTGDTVAQHVIEYGSSNHVKFYAIENGQTLLSYGRRLYVVSDEGRKIRLVKQFQSPVETLYRDRIGNHWIGTLGEGVFRTRNFQDYEVIYPNLYVSDIREDTFGGLWISTLHNGVFFAPLPSTRVVDSNAYLQMVSGGGFLGIAREHGFTILQEKDFSTLLDTIVDFKVTGLDWSERHACWLYNGTTTIGWFSLDEDFQKYPLEYRTFQRFAHQNRWILSYGSMAWSAWKDQLPSSIPDYQGWWGNWTGMVMMGPDETIWSSDATATYRYIIPSMRPIDTLGARSVKIIFPSTGPLWIATRNQGIWEYEPATRQVVRHDLETGWPTRSIADLELVGDSLVVVHREGVTVISGSKVQHVPLVAEMVPDADDLILAGGRWVLGNRNRILAFDPKDVLRKVEPEIEVHIQVSGLEGPLVRPDLLDLAHDENQLVVSLNYPWFRSNRPLSMRFRLHPTDRWQAFEKELVLPDLSAGDYQLEIQFQTSSGSWKPVGRAIPFFIQKPVYQQGWFWITGFLATSVLIYWALWARFEGRLNREKERSRLQARQRRLQSKLLTTQLKPHFIFNAINNLQYFLEAGKQKEAGHYLQRFSRLLRNVLESTESDLVPFADEVALYDTIVRLESMSLPGKEEIHIRYDFDEVDPQHTFVPPALIQPYVENAIAHGLRRKSGAKYIVIVVSVEGEELLISITDNGIGRSHKSRHQPSPKLQKSFGLQIAEQRIRAIADKDTVLPSVEITDLKHPNHEPAGTRVTVRIPHFTSPHELLDRR